MAPNRSKTQKRPQENGEAASMPSFDQTALAQLTAKIDRDLEARNAKNLNGGKRKRGVDTADDDDDDGEAEAAAGRKAAKTPKTPKPTKTAKANKKPAEPKTKAGPSPIANGRPQKGEASADKSAVMLDEIKALGGDEHDLELVAGIDSDAEEASGSGDGSVKAAVGDDAAVDDSFRNELARFAAGLGFDQVREEDDDDDEDKGESELEGVEVGEDEEEGEEEEEEGEEEEEEEQKKEPEVVQKEARKPLPAQDMVLPRNPKFARLMFEPRPDWHSVDLKPLPRPSADSIGRLAPAVARLKAYAETLLETDAAAYRSILNSSSSHRFMSTIMSSGTMSDKISALTLEVQEAPVHNTKAFETLIGLAGKRSRGQAIAALGALVDLLGNGGLLPSDRRLRAFQNQPGLLGALQAAGPVATVLAWGPNEPKLPGALTKAHLVAWQYEDWLKDAVFRMLQQLEVWCNDEIAYARSRALDFVYGLLRSKPEQEANLLRLLVNKLGDRERKIASRASYLLLQLLTLHPGMKPIVVQTIEQEILLRPGQSLRAKYYGINTLNQTILSNKEPAVADALVRVYFELFLALLKSGALGGVTDAFGGGGGGGGGPSTSEGAADTIAGKDKDAETAGKDRSGKGVRKRGVRDHRRGEAVNGTDKKTGGSKNEGNEKDVAEKLVSALLTGVNRAVPFAATDNLTLEQHINTLFRITHSSNFNTSIQALMLVQQVAMSKQLAVDRFYRTLYESLLDPRLVTSSKQAMYLNLLYRALKNDVDVRRVKAFVKRMLQIATLHQPPFVCGILFMVAELETAFPDLKSLRNDPEADDDEEEHYRDVVEGEDVSTSAAAEPPKAPPRVVYDGRKRDPEYSNAERSCLWELVPYFRHFHPSVTAFASNLLVRQTSLPKPDMANHTLMHFLDKFVYRNPKAVSADGTKARGTSIMQPLAVTTTPSTGAVQIVAPGKSASHGAAARLNSAAFWDQKIENVAAEDVFFHTYFTQVGKPAQSSRAAKRAAAQKDKDGKAAAALGGGGGDGDDSDLEDAEEEEIWKALKSSRPDIEADDEGASDVDMDDDDDMSGLESLLNMSDSDDDDDDDNDVFSDNDDGMEVDDDEAGGVEFADFSGDEEEEAGAGAVGKAAASSTAQGSGEDGLVALDERKAARQRRKELKAMPTFASADDYAAMLEADEDETF